MRRGRQSLQTQKTSVQPPMQPTSSASRKLLSAVTLLGIIAGVAAVIVGLQQGLSHKPLQMKYDSRIVHAMGMAFNIPGEDSISWWSGVPAIEHLASYVRGADRLQFPEQRRVRVAIVSADFFSVFQLVPAQGRYFRVSDEDSTPTGTAVLSHRRWRYL